MTIEIKENLVGIWYYPIGDTGDWMGAVSVKDDGDYELLYRHRYYNDDRTDEFSEDTKNWYGGTIANEGQTREDVITVMRTLVKSIADTLGEKHYEVLMKDGDVDAFVEELSAQPFSHVQMLDRDKAH